MSRHGLFSGLLFGFERRHHALLPFPQFLARLWRNFFSALVLVGGSLGLGMLGYHGFEGLGWTDSFLNAAMLLSGMGPLESPQTEGGKLFAGIYALYSGLAVLVIASLLLAPLVHRLLHRFHAEDDDAAAAPPSPPSPRGKTDA